MKSERSVRCRTWSPQFPKKNPPPPDLCTTVVGSNPFEILTDFVLPDDENCGLPGCYARSSDNYQECSSQLLRGGRLKSRTAFRGQTAEEQNTIIFKTENLPSQNYSLEWRPEWSICDKNTASVPTSSQFSILRDKLHTESVNWNVSHKVRADMEDRFYQVINLLNTYRSRDAPTV
jgi:hypothetical protein